MPDVTLNYKAAIFLRRFPVVHRPLKWARRSGWGGIRRWFTNLLRSITSGMPAFGPPAGLFSVRDLLQRKELEGRIVLEDQGRPELPEPSIQVISGLHQHDSQPWPIVWSRHKNARLVSSSLALLDERKRLSIESTYMHFHPDEPAFNRIRLPRPVKLPGRWTSIVSWWCPTTGAAPFTHWILDALPRLALLKEFPSDTGILVPSALAGYQKESLKLLGLLDRVRCTPEQHLVVEDYYFSSPTVMIDCYNPYGVNWLRSAFLQHADKSYQGPKRFVIQRKGKSRGILNEQEFNDFFRGLGWEIIDTEKLTFAQEIQLFSQAEACAGVLGSGFTNTVWSSPGCKVITFVADNWVDGWIESLCAVNRLDYYWEICSADHAMMAKVDLAKARDILRQAGLLG